MTNPELTSFESLPAPQPEAMPADPGRAHGLMNWLRNSRPGRFLADVSMATAVALPGAGGAAIALAEAQPAMAENTPTATASNLEQECVQAATVQEVLGAKMLHPGKKNQAIYTKISYGDMPIECNDQYRRVARIKFQLQDYQHHNRWFTLTFPQWEYLLAGNQAATGSPYIQESGHEGGYVYYHKTPGPGRTHVRAFIKDMLKDKQSGEIVGQKIEKIPIEVEAPIRNQ